MIVISPYSKPLINGNRNAKNYPYFDELIYLIKNRSIEPIVQIGTEGEERIGGTNYFVNKMPLPFLIERLARPDIRLIIGVDNFLQHLITYQLKSMVVIWGQSDPELFGYKENFNLLKDRKYLRKDQFNTWEAVPFLEEAFLSAQEVFEQITHLL